MSWGVVLVELGGDRGLGAWGVRKWGWRVEVEMGGGGAVQELSQRICYIVLG